ncbi:MAG TPA: amidohydrolase family protein [Spirochaetia bacterium]
MNAEHEAWLAQVREEPIDPSLPICDAHHHLWDRPDGRYLIDDFLGDARGGHRIVRTVYVECRSMYRKDGPVEMRSVGETEHVTGVAERAARAPGERVGVACRIVGYADLRLGAGVAPVLEAHLMAGGNRFRGIRNVSTWHEDPTVALKAHNIPGLLSDTRFREGFALLREYGLSFDACLFFTQLAELADLARAFPNTPIILNHAGGILGTGPYAGKSDEVFRVWKRGMAALAFCPNVCVKLGGLGEQNAGFGWRGRALPPTSAEMAKAMAPYFLACIEMFGADRCMFESNFPVDRRSCSYTVVWNAFKRITERFSPGERIALFHDTAARAYRFSPR